MEGRRGEELFTGKLLVFNYLDRYYLLVLYATELRRAKAKEFLLSAGCDVIEPWGAKTYLLHNFGVLVNRPRLGIV